MADIKDKIQSTAEGPAEVSSDQGTVKAQPIKDLIEADRYLKSQANAANPFGCLRRARIVLPGSNQ
jgi:hypothetical protein